MKRPQFYLLIWGDGFGHSTIRGLFSTEEKAKAEQGVYDFIEGIILDEDTPEYSAVDLAIQILDLNEEQKECFMRLVDADFDL